MKITLECDGKKVSYSSEDLFDSFIGKKVESEEDITWPFLVGKFFGLLATHGYYVPDNERLMEAIETILSEDYTSLFDDFYEDGDEDDEDDEDNDETSSSEGVKEV